MNVTTDASPYGAGHPRYTSWIDKEQRFESIINMPDPCLLTDNETMKTKIVGKIVDNDSTGPD